MKWTEIADFPNPGSTATVLSLKGAMALAPADQRASNISELVLPRSSSADLDAKSRLAEVTEQFAQEQRKFVDEGIQLVSLLARLNSLRWTLDLRQGQVFGAAHCKSERAASSPQNAVHRLPQETAADEGPEILHQMNKADLLWREQNASENPATNVSPSDMNGHIARLEVRCCALDRLTRSMRRRVSEMQAEIGDLAAGLFDCDAPALSGGGLRALEVDARLDIAAQLLADGMSEGLVTKLARLDPDVVLALSSDLD